MVVGNKSNLWRKKFTLIMLRKKLANSPRKVLKMFQKPLAKFTSKKGKEIEVVPPSIDRLDDFLGFINRLVAEDTFLSLTGNPKTIEEERLWLKGNIENVKTGKTIFVWAICNGKIIGQCDLNRGHARDPHVGTVGLMTDKDFRDEGIGRFLIEYVLEKAKEMPGLKIIRLHVFSDNAVAIDLYKKLGFSEFARLPNGFYRKNKYSDALQMYKNLTPTDSPFERGTT